MAASVRANVRKWSHLVSATEEDIRQMRTDSESLMQTGMSRFTSESMKQMDVFVLATDIAEKFQKVSFHLRSAAETMQEGAKSLVSGHFVSKLRKRKFSSDGANASRKKELNANVAEITRKLRELIGILRSTADILQNAADSLIPDHLSSQSRKRKLNANGSNELQKKEEVDDKCVQDQLDVDGYENFHADRLSTSADLAGKSVAEQRQITQAEWVLLSENSRRSYIERSDTGEEGQPGPSKKRRVN